MDPYFINGLLEHWSHSVRTLTSPASPPIFLPAPRTLGYSHGLVLFAGVYVPLRLALHPFVAYTATIFLVILTGLLCLYVLLRQLGVSFVEAFALTAMFGTSANVMNKSTAIWTQRASVFLIPPILLLALAALRARDTRVGITLAAVSGFLGTAMYTQDFYTAHFAVFMALPFVVVAWVDRAGSRLPAWLWNGQTRIGRFAAGLGAVALIAAAELLMYGGGETRIAGVRVAARDWRRPAIVALAAAVVVLWPRRSFLAVHARRAAASARLAALVGGAALGAAMFVWIYWDPMRELRTFPAEQVWNALPLRDPYPSVRPFVFAGIVAALAWLPGLGLDRIGRRRAVWLLLSSVFVWFVPLKFGNVALWTIVIARLPGFAVIRDPKRIIYLYELAVVIATALIMTRAPRLYRGIVIAACAGVMLVSARPEQFDFARPRSVFRRWVMAPIEIDPSCRSFFIEGASAEYMSRSPHMWTLYGIDAMFIALHTSIPTLNGYSAWVPPGWELMNPQEPTYPGRVQQWIDRNRLTGVCRLDIDARQMRPR
jgi:hypothetical protein